MNKQRESGEGSFLGSEAPKNAAPPAPPSSEVSERPERLRFTHTCVGNTLEIYWVFCCPSFLLSDKPKPLMIKNPPTHVSCRTNIEALFILSGEYLAAGSSAFILQNFFPKFVAHHCAHFTDKNADMGFDHPSIKFTP